MTEQVLEEQLLAYVRCVTNRSGYERSLVIGDLYLLLDIQDGIFPGDYYVIVELPDGKTVTTLLNRFDITKEQAAAYVKAEHGK